MFETELAIDDDSMLDESSNLKHYHGDYRKVKIFATFP